MNRKIVSALVLAAAAGSALAEGPLQHAEPFVGTRTRAEVQDELATYKRAGVNPWAFNYNHLRGFASSTTREQVQAEYIASRNEVAALHREDSGSAYFTQLAGRRLQSETLAGQPINAR